MAEIIVATLNVSFEADTTAATGNLKLEIDDREDGENGGDTSFAPGDNPVFFIFKDKNVSLLTTPPKSTAGSVAAHTPSTGTKSIDENISFSNSDSASLGYPPKAALGAWNGTSGMRWLGKSYEIKKDGTLVDNTALPENTGSELKMNPSKNIAGVLQCVYESEGDLYKLTVEKTIAEQFKEVLVIAIGTAT